MNWQGTMALEGSKQVGLVGTILDGYDKADIEKPWNLAKGRPLLDKEGEIYLAYLAKGGEIDIAQLPGDLN